MVSPAMCCKLSSRMSRAADPGSLAHFSSDNSTHKTDIPQVLEAHERSVCLNTYLENQLQVLEIAVLVLSKFKPLEVGSNPF